MQDEIFSSGGAQEMDRARLQVSDDVDFEFLRENSDLISRVSLKQFKDNNFFAPNFNEFEAVSAVENPTLIDDEEDKESLPAPTPVTKEPNKPPVAKKRPLEPEKKFFLNVIKRKCRNKNNVSDFLMTFLWNVLIYHIVFQKVERIDKDGIIPSF